MAPAASIPAALLALCATPPRATDPSAIDEALFRAAIEHGVAPLVASRLETAALSMELTEGLALYREGEAIRAARALGQLSQILRTLASAGIPAMPIKGPVLAHTLFGDPAARASRDLDIMIPGQRIDAALTVLAGLGYHADLTPRLLRVQRRYGGQHILFHADHDPVEPHWEPAPRTLALGFDTPGLWSRSRSGQVADAPAQLPDAADLLLILAIQGTKDRWPRLKPVADVAALLHRMDSASFAAARQRATACGSRRILDVAVLLTVDLLGAPLHAPIDDGIARRLAHTAAQRIRAGAAPLPAPHVLCADYWSGHERWRDRIAYAIRTAATPRVPHYDRLHFPPGLDWLHYAIKMPWDVVSAVRRNVASSASPNHSVGGVSRRVV